MWVRIMYGNMFDTDSFLYYTPGQGQEKLLISNGKQYPMAHLPFDISKGIR
jgi:hypothetical protein